MVDRIENKAEQVESKTKANDNLDALSLLKESAGRLSDNSGKQSSGNSGNDALEFTNPYQNSDSSSAANGRNRSAGAGPGSAESSTDSSNAKQGGGRIEAAAPPAEAPSKDAARTELKPSDVVTPPETSLIKSH